MLLLFALASASHAQEPITVRLRWLSQPGPEGRVVALPLEEYIAAVLAGEAGGLRSDEALKAIAVAVRSFAVRQRGRHRTEGFDFCDTTHCQDFRRVGVTSRVVAAAEETAGELVWHQGRPVAAYYGQDCGGRSESAGIVWPGEQAPYLTSREDTACVRRGTRTWEQPVEKEALRAALQAAGVALPAPLRTFEITQRSAAGRATQIRLTVGMDTRRILPAAQVRFAVGRALGWSLVRSDWYEVRDDGPRLVFRGRGAGHGVGLCQLGADERGQQGATYRQILAHYFPETAVGVTAQGLPWRRRGGERVDVWVTDESDASLLLPLADRLLRESEQALGLTLAGRARVRAFPSVATYRDATGEPGWVAGSTQGRTVRLQPARLLRSSGSLEAVLRHELLHAIIESRAHPSVPVWFREGLVLALCGGPTGANPPHGAPLTESAFRQPASAAALRNSYEAAGRRVRRLLDRYTVATVANWLERGVPAEALAAP